MTRTIILTGLLVMACAQGRSQDRLIPADTAFVLEIDVRKIIQSGIGQETVVPLIKSRIHEITVLNQALNKLGIDPLRDLGKITLTAAGAKDTERLMIVARGSWNAISMLERLQKLSSASSKNGIEKISIGTTTIFRATLVENKAKSVFLAVTADGALAVSPAKDYIIDSTMPKPSISLSNKYFQQAVTGLDEQSFIRFAVSGQAIERAAIPEGPARELLANVRSISGGLAFVGNDLRLEITLDAGEAPSATAMRESIEDLSNQSLGFLGILANQKREYRPVLSTVKNMRSSTRGSTVTLRAAMSLDDFRGILNLSGLSAGNNP
jgi:hypothetical protein